MNFVYNDLMNINLYQLELIGFSGHSTSIVRGQNFAIVNYHNTIQILLGGGEERVNSPFVTKGPFQFPI